MSTLNPGLRIITLLACALVSTAVRAQIWQGPASLEIKAEGKGASVAGANVELLYLALDPPAGPPPVQLDSRGRAVVSGLAEGMWRVSVSREGFMTWQGEVDVRRDDKPKLAATFQQNVPGAVHMMQVKIARGKPSGSSAPPPPPQIAERPAPRPAEPTPAPAPAPAPAAPVQEATPPAEEAPISHATPKLTPPEPETPPQPPAEPRPQPAAPTPAPHPAPEPVQPTPQPAPPAPSTPPASERPTPAPAPMPVPPQPAPPAPAPGGSVLHRSYADRTCYECKPGEASLSAERVVSRGAGCGAAVRDLLAQGGDPAGLPDGCAVLRLTLPPGARYTGYRYEIQERSGSVDCQAGRDCPGGGRWPVDPALARSADGTIVSAAFENPGAGNERRAILTIYYTER